MNGSAAPFPWPALTGDEARIANALSGASGRASVRLGGRRHRVAFPAGFAEPYRPVLRAVLSLDGRPAALDLDRIPFPEHLGYPQGGLEASAVPGDILAALLEGVLADLLDGAEAALGRPVRLESAAAAGARDPDPAGWPVAVELAEEDGPGGLRARLFLAPEDLACLAAKVEPAAQGPQPDWIGAPIPLRYRVGTARLPAAEYTALEPGDIVFLAGDPAGKGGLRLCAGRQDMGIWKATWRKGHVVLEEEIKVENNGTAASPGDARDGQATAEAAADGRLDALELLVTFDMGSRPATLADLRGLAPGAVLPLPDNPEGKVTLRVSGQAVGLGSLLMVDGRAGVRIEEIRPSLRGA